MIKALIDLRGQFGPARDQGTRPTCLAFAGSDAHAAARGGSTALSAEWAYYHALKRDGGGSDDGATFSGMLATIKSDGQPVEAEWPYVDPLTDIGSWKPPVSIKQLFYRDHDICAVNIQEIVDHLARAKPVLIGMTLSDAFYDPTVEGIVDNTEAVDPKRRHAVVAVGTGENKSVPYLLIRNSWGAAWGLDGHAWVSIDYAGPRLFAASVLTKEP